MLGVVAIVLYYLGKIELTRTVEQDPTSPVVLQVKSFHQTVNGTEYKSYYVSGDKNETHLSFIGI